MAVADQPETEELRVALRRLRMDRGLVQAPHRRHIAPEMLSPVDYEHA